MRASKEALRPVRTTANSTEEAAITKDADLDLIMGNVHITTAVRDGAPEKFLIAALGLLEFVTERHVQTATLAAMQDAADSIYNARGPHIVELLAREDIPVVCHLGLDLPKSTWRSGLRAAEKTADEAIAIWQAYRVRIHNQ